MRQNELKVRYRKYWAQFAIRILVLCLTAVCVVYYPAELEILEGMNFFGRFSPLHLLWLLWVWYMTEKLLPARFGQHRGSMKYQESMFAPSKEYESKQGETGAWKEWRRERRRYAQGAAAVFCTWAAAGLLIFLLHRGGVLDNGELLMLAALFYVGDMVCILIWCPFRHFLMKNRCCTQCRIYNWDTWMMILPLLSIRGFFTYSLSALAAAAAGLWEIKHLTHPERYYALTNENIRCASCKGEPGCYLVRKNKPFWWFLRNGEERQEDKSDGTDEPV